MTGQPRKIPMEAIAGLTLVAIAAVALFRTSGAGRPDGDGQTAGEAVVVQVKQDAPVGNGADERDEEVHQHGDGDE